MYGNSFEACLVAVAVPDEAQLLAWAAAEGLPQDVGVRPGLGSVFGLCVMGLGLCLWVEVCVWVLQVGNAGSRNAG